MEGGLLSLKWNNHRSSFIHVLSSLRKKDSFCDVTLACEGKFYPSHKLVLSTCSEYFQDMFQHTQCKHPVIVLKDIHCEDLEALLNYMYLGEVNVLQEKLSTLIKAAECLKIKGLAVPDDPPKDAIGEKRSSGHDSAPESKRRRTEPSKSVSKHLSKPSETYYRQNSVNEESSYPLPNRPPQNDIASEISSFDNDSSVSPIKNKGGDTNFIKQEPPDAFDVEDTKDGVLQSTHNTFLSPLPEEEASNMEPMTGTSESKEMWTSESRSGDDYPPLDGGEGAPAGNEDGSQNETVWNDSVWSDSLPPLNDVPTDMVPMSYCPTTALPVYSCDVCNYKCSIRMNLLKHLRIHTGEKPFACSWCSYSTTQSSNLLKHMRRVHKKEMNQGPTHS